MRIGIDWGGTKIEAISIDSKNGNELNRIRVDSPKDNYKEIISTIAQLTNDISTGQEDFTVGIGMPGSLHPDTGLVQVSNTKALENMPVKKDIEKELGFEVKIANDADCLALSEAIDGAGKNYKTVFAVILGTGVGAGYVVNKELVEGPNKLSGEWGQNPIPGPMDDYEKTTKRHCGRIGAIEMFISGPGLENHYKYKSGRSLNSREIIDLYRVNDELAIQVMDEYFERTARSISTFINNLDPEVIVCGGGMSEVGEL